MIFRRIISLSLMLMTFTFSNAASIVTGAAPKGDAKAVAARIIKYNFPQCKKVLSAKRNPDDSILATCDGIDYLVFTMYSAREGRMLELAMNCNAAKELLRITCAR